MCLGALSPTKRPRLFGLSCRLRACAYASWWRDGPTDVLAFTPTHQLEEEHWIGQGWVRTSLCQLAAFTECHPSQRQPSFPQDLSHVEAAALRYLEEDQYRFPPEVYNWDNGLVRSGVWRYPSFEERGLIFGFQAATYRR